MTLRSLISTSFPYTTLFRSEPSRDGGATGCWERGTDLAAQHVGLSQCEQAHLALAGATAQSEFAAKTLCAPASRKLNRMAVTFFTWRDRADSDYFFAVFFSAFSIFFTNFSGFLSKSFLQSLQQSLISR